jgi:hypothetical protein
MFKYPDFEDGSLECRRRNDEVAIYGSADGFRALAKLCEKISTDSTRETPEHIHLEDCGILTKDSLRLTLVWNNPT